MPGDPSRIRQYFDQQNARQADDRVSDLEERLESEERRSLRLQRQLDEETALRARAERVSRESEQELEIAQGKLAELEKKNAPKRRSSGTAKGRQRVGDGGAVPDGPQRVDGGTAPVRKSRAKPADSGGDAVKTGSPAKPGGSRKRGNVK